MSTNKDLDNVLSSLTQYRNSLMAKLQEKGVEIASDSTLYAGLQAIDAIQGGGVQSVAGYIMNDNGVLSFRSLQDSTSTSVSALYIPDTPAQPQYQGGGSSMNFYKCTSVDASDSTWSGRKAVFVEGVYEFQSNSTQNLTYTEVKPEVGQIYSQNALIKAASLWDGIPTKGLVFHASLSKSMGNAQSGQAISTSGSVSYQTYKGIPCVYVSGGSYLYMNDTSSLPSGNAPYTLSGWGNCQQYTSSYFGTILGYGVCNQGGQGVNIAFWGLKEGAEYTNILIHHHDRSVSDPSLYVTDKWYHVATTFDGSTQKLYIDGQLVATGQYTLNLQQTYFRIGYAQFDYYFNGYIAGDRIYNRALSESQISYLARQFSPTA